MARKYVYSFGGGKADGNESMKNFLGGKGANLAEMAGHPKLRLPVPPGFTITTEVCTYYYNIETMCIYIKEKDHSLMRSYAVSLFLPFNLRLFNTFLPLLVFILFLNPCSFFLCLFLG